MYEPLTDFNQNTFRNGRVVKNDDIKAVIKAFGQTCSNNNKETRLKSLTLFRGLCCLRIQ